ncbi:hypothetical protein J4H92_09575 [Leucobacter weissii]|uniref:SURF1-like protein n=1 Tax=Leucobacter weissii TaxID=1983706 RepID=A0A939ML18_9MICO|nr:SURF1 family cytochrome oxidase biogenesis protein [Leucobacter weissii]MBO1902195.1 hypothetical protein [Leucobacter weissii]
MSKRPQYEGEPSLARVMRKPKWIAALALALVVAGVFAWLGQWQLSHAITLEAEGDAHSETPRPIDEVLEPGTSVDDTAAGMVVALSADPVLGDLRVVEERVNRSAEGAWVTGHVVVEGAEGHLPVAIGWAPTAAAAQQSLEALESELGASGSRGAIELEGRYMPPDAAAIPEAADDPLRITTMVPAQLVNLWEPFDGLAYSGFLVLHPGGSGDPLSADALAAVGLQPIESVPPLPRETINWLNLFYAAEWVVFAGFAVFFWTRLVRDDWERIHELRLQTEAA